MHPLLEQVPTSSEDTFDFSTAELTALYIALW